MSERWNVEVRETPEHAPVSHVCSELPITIGRHEGNDVQLPRAFVSGFHARIERVGAGLSVLDVGSTNGVRVRCAGGQEVRIASHEPHALSSCDNEFSIGAYRIRVESTPVFLSAVSGQLSLPALTPGGSSGNAEPAAVVRAVPVAGSSVSPLASQPGEASRRRACQAAALAGLEELMRALAPGLCLESPGDVAQLVARLQMSLELSCQGLVQLRRGQRRCASALRLPVVESSDLGNVGHPALLARQLLDARQPVAALRASLRAEYQLLARHQVALLEGMIEGAGALLAELSPERVEARAESLRVRRWLPLVGKLRALRRAYRDHHARLSRSDSALSLVFGRAFRDAYEAYLRGARKRLPVRSTRRAGQLG